MTKEKTSAVPIASPIMQQITMLNIRLNDMMTQFNTVIKMMINETVILKKENSELKAKYKETQKTR